MTTTAPLTIKMHGRDNVAIVANNGGLPAGTELVDAFATGVVLKDRVPQGHKVALVDLPAGAAVLRYGIPIGHTLQAVPDGSWASGVRSTTLARGVDTSPPAARAAAAARSAA